MQLAYRNFSGSLFHFGGQNAAYNGKSLLRFGLGSFWSVANAVWLVIFTAFTPPPSNYTENYQWTTGAICKSQII